MPPQRRQPKYRLAPKATPAAGLSTAEFTELLAAKRVVGNAILKLEHKHAYPEQLRGAWSHISLWLEDNA
jgi:hypothetical protein